MTGEPAITFASKPAAESAAALELGEYGGHKKRKPIKTHEFIILGD